MNDCYVFLWLEEVYSIVLFVIPRLFVEIAICTACYFASWGVDALLNTDKHLPRRNVVGLIYDGAEEVHRK